MNDIEDGHFLHQWAGFTLIELVVVVLIVALLTAVAVPQYNRAVVKFRYKSMFPLAKAIRVGQEHFYLTHGYYAQKLSDLDISSLASPSQNVSISLHNDNSNNYLLMTYKKLNNTLVTHYQHSPQYPNHIYCEAKADDPMAVWLCETSLKGEKIEDGSFTQGYVAYVLKGNATALENIEVPHEPIHYTDQSGNATQSLELEQGDVCSASKKDECQYLEAYGSECETKGDFGCAYSEYNEQSTCNANSAGGCFKSTFVDSKCVAKSGGTADSTSCGGKDREDSQSHYIRSTCENKSRSGFACGRSVYEDLSRCVSSKSGGCGKSSFTDHSVCEGWHSSACDRSKFYNNSICYAYVSGACLYEEGTTYYDDTSYCAGAQEGFSYCPVGTPAPQTGKTWRKCTAEDNAPKSGMSCY